MRRDFVRVGKGWPELKDWALAWLRRIRELYHLNRQRLAVRKNTCKLARAERALRRTIVAMRQQLEAELANRQLRLPCRKVLESLQEHWEGLTRFVDDPRIPMDNNASERRLRGPALSWENGGKRGQFSQAMGLFELGDKLVPIDEEAIPEKEGKSCPSWKPIITTALRIKNRSPGECEH